MDEKLLIVPCVEHIKDLGEIIRTNFSLLIASDLRDET